ncbi:hypothetical protein QBC38DRAFT_456838 [Podospora fimiseda]|uniref:Uncharacterized protein n=1 Tax=Podospora fimiseda TaxID=252190 RepID=A0AAN7BM52_9PEZI|nr:hypothetical protein QBC38DRAFT_456838 [Podospora fimiseda]
MPEHRNEVPRQNNICDVIIGWAMHYFCKNYFLFLGFTVWLSRAPALDKFPYIAGLMLQMEGFQTDEARVKVEALMKLQESPDRCMTIN